MGIWSSIFCCCRRKRRPLFEAMGEELEELKTKIEEMTQLNRVRTEQRRAGLRRIVMSGVALYAALAAWLYVSEPIDPTFRTTRLAALILFPLLVLALHRQFAFLVNYDIRRRASRVKQLTEHLDRKIEMLKEQTNFLKTQNLINRYQTPIKQQQAASPGQSPNVPGTTRRTGRKGPRPPLQTPAGKSNAAGASGAGDRAVPGTPLPQRTGGGAEPQNVSVRLANDSMDVVTPFKRGNVDKVFDYLLGEGPNNRFALICKRCGTHNGLIREEDLGIRYRCSACSFLNGDRPLSAAAGPAAASSAAHHAPHGGQLQKPNQLTADSASIAEEPEEAVEGESKIKPEPEDEDDDSLEQPADGDSDHGDEDAYSTPLRKRLTSGQR